MNLSDQKLNTKVLAIDIGGTFIKIGLLENGELIKSSKIPTEQNKYCILIEQIAKTFESYGQEIIGLGISVPGTILENGVIQGGGALSYLDGNNLKEDLQQKLKVRVEVVNDADSLTYSAISEDEEIESLLSIVIGTGLGASLYINGKVWAGIDNFSEGGALYNPLYSKDKLMWSTHSWVAIVNEINNKLNSNYTGEELIEFFEKKENEYITEKVNEFFEAIAILTWNFNNLLNVGHIYFAGGITGYPNFLKVIKEKIFEIEKRVDWDKTFSTKFRVQKHAGNSGMIGAEKFWRINSGR